MWPFDNQRRVRKLSPYIGYCRGRVRPILSVDEVARYMTGDIRVMIGFVLGSLDSEAEGKPLPTEAEVDAEVARRLLPAEAPASTPPAALPAAVDAETTERVRPAPFIGAPSSSRA